MKGVIVQRPLPAADRTIPQAFTDITSAAEVDFGVVDPDWNEIDMLLTQDEDAFADLYELPHDYDRALTFAQTAQANRRKPIKKPIGTIRPRPPTRP